MAAQGRGPQIDTSSHTELKRQSLKFRLEFSGKNMREGTVLQRERTAYL